MAYKILLVDDEKDIIEIFKNSLLLEGYEVVVAYDGEEALVKVKDDDPDLIVLDLNMPKLNGFEVLKEIREKHVDKWRPVIICSGQDELETLKKCYNMEADYYLIKPCAINSFLRGVETMISLIPYRKPE